MGDVMAGGVVESGLVSTNERGDEPGRGQGHAADAG
jgi:hypothetical protein